MASALACGAASPLAAQDDARPPREVAEAVVAFYNRDATLRLTGESRIAPGTELVGDVAVIGGPLVIAGRVRGSVVVLNGGVRFEPGGEVEGDLLVVGGSVERPAVGRVAGRVDVHPEPLRVHRDGERLALSPPAPADAFSAGREFRFGRAELMLGVRRSYNRVEGLPIAFGPRLRFGGSNPTRIEALGIYRSAVGLRLDTDRTGYVVRLEQSLGGRDAVRVGAALRSEIEPIERWGVSDRESSLSTFLLHRDYRDHYLREGWAAYLRVAPRSRPLRGVLELRGEEHATVAAEAPWSLFDNDEEWRPQPLVAEGTLRSVRLELAADTRNDLRDPSTGWLTRVAVEKGLGGSLVAGAAPGLDGRFRPEDRPTNDRFATGLLDVRRYERIGPTSRLAIRVLAAGSLDGQALPAQRQHTLGGEGSLPAYQPFTVDCGARAVPVERDGDRLVPYYGCDRLVLVQLEYRASFFFLEDLTRRWGLDVRLAPEWVAFFDTGRAWTDPDARHGRGGGQDDFAADAGLGVRVGAIGAYWAHSLSGRGQGTNFFLRLEPRF